MIRRDGCTTKLDLRLKQSVELELLNVVEDVTQSLVREQRQALHEERQDSEELLALVRLDNVLHDVVAVFEVDAQRLHRLRLISNWLRQLAF